MVIMFSCLIVYLDIFSWDRILASPDQSDWWWRQCSWRWSSPGPRHCPPGMLCHWDPPLAPPSSILSHSSPPTCQTCRHRCEVHSYSDSDHGTRGWSRTRHLWTIRNIISHFTDCCLHDPWLSDACVLYLNIQLGFLYRTTVYGSDLYISSPSYLSRL